MACFFRCMSFSGLVGFAFGMQGLTTPHNKGIAMMSFVDTDGNANDFMPSAKKTPPIKSTEIVSVDGEVAFLDNTQITEAVPPIIPGYAFSHNGIWLGCTNAGKVTTLQACANKCTVRTGCVAFFRKLLTEIPQTCHILTEISGAALTHGYEHYIAYRKVSSPQPVSNPPPPQPVSNPPQVVQPVSNPSQVPMPQGRGPHCEVSGGWGLCAKCDNTTYLTPDGHCLHQCAPGFYKHGEVDETKMYGDAGHRVSRQWQCAPCNGETRRRSDSYSCTPCTSGNIMKQNSDTCQRLQDTCSLAQCQACLKCVQEARAEVTACKTRIGRHKCIDLGDDWCPELMSKVMECEHFSFACWNKLLCNDDQICPEWKRVRCGVDEPDTLLQGGAAQANHTGPGGQLMQRKEKGSGGEGRRVEDSLEDKCTG